MPARSTLNANSVTSDTRTTSMSVQASMTPSESTTLFARFSGFTTRAYTNDAKIAATLPSVPASPMTAT